MHSLFLREVSIDWDAVSDYTQHIAALHSFDRLIFQKQITFFTGENGSGKTTLMKTILGLQKPLKGEIHLGDGLHANEIGYLPQQTVLQKDFNFAKNTR